MYIKNLQGKHYRTVAILGAGASYGEEALTTYANRIAPGSRTPLDNSFFQLLQLDGYKYTTENFESILADVQNEFGRVQGTSLEAYLSRKASYLQLYRTLSDYKGSDQAGIEDIDASLKRVIRDVFHRTTDSIHFDECWHSHFCSSLEGNDVVISFNYDLIADRMLNSTRRWHENIYEIPINFSIEHESDHNYEGVRLLKPHGSVNFAIENDELKVYHPTDHASISSATLPGIVPPLIDKSSIIQRSLSPIWTAAATHIEQAEALIVIGYSAPKTDTMAHALLRSGINNSKLKILINVNPSSTDASWVEQVILSGRSGIERVYRYDNWRSFIVSETDV